MDEDSQYGYPVLPVFCTVTVTDPLNGGPAVFLSAPERVWGRAGSTFNVTVSASGWPEGSYRLLDGLITVPDCVRVRWEPGTRLTGGNLTCHLDGTELRFVYTNTALDDVGLAGSRFPAELFTLTIELQENAADYQDLEFCAGPVTLKRTFGELPFSFDLSGAKAAVHLMPGLDVSVRELFTGDGSDLIPDGRRAWAVSLTRREPVHIAYKGKALFSSEEFTSKYGVSTFILFADASEPLDDLVNKDSYAWLEDGKTGPAAGIGDADSNGVINAQDALDVISCWLRIGPAPDDARILSMNVTGDCAVNTFDAISIMEFFISGAEFPVLGK